MRSRDETTLILNLALSEARELERLARKHWQRKLKCWQFIAAVEEISAKLQQQIVALLVDDEDVDVLDETNIPF